MGAADDRQLDPVDAPGGVSGRVRLARRDQYLDRREETGSDPAVAQRLQRVVARAALCL